MGISVSSSPDLERLGLLETHFRVVIGEITRSVLLAGGGLIYGGHLEQGGYTTFVLRELQRYARRDRPLLACLSWDTQQGLSSEQIEDFRSQLGLFGYLVCLDQDGRPLPMNADAAPERESSGRTGESPGVAADIRRRSLTGFRRYMSGQQVGRVFLGGRRTGFKGNMPGLLEELLLALERNQPVYLAGGFGGMTFDVARILGVHREDWPIAADVVPDDPGYRTGLEALDSLIGSAASAVCATD